MIAGDQELLELHLENAHDNFLGMGKGRKSRPSRSRKTDRSQRKTERKESRFEKKETRKSDRMDRRDARKAKRDGLDPQEDQGTLEKINNTVQDGLGAIDGVKGFVDENSEVLPRRRNRRNDAPFRGRNNRQASMNLSPGGYTEEFDSDPDQEGEEMPAWQVLGILALTGGVLWFGVKKMREMQNPQIA